MLASAVPSDPAGALEPQGPVAGEIAELWWLMLALGGVAFAIFAVALAVALLRRPSAEDDRSPTGSRGSWSWIPLGGVALPVVVVLVVLGATVVTMDRIERDPEGALQIEVIGHQWWWEVRYPDLGVTTSGEVHLPVGRPVAVRLTSADVIHSFWVPALAGKLDALPEDVNTLVLQADEVGELQGVCAEFCGLQHAKMDLVVIAEPPEDFEAWAASQAQPATEAATATAATGREVFTTAGCADCHTIRGTDAVGAVGPDLTHVASRRALAGATVTNDASHLREWVRDPNQFKDGVLMPATELDDDRMAALVEYLGQLR